MTIHATGKDLETVIDYLSKNADALLNWFEDNYFKMNGDKCKPVVTKNEDNASLIIDGHTGNKCVKLLGIKIDNNLDLNDHVSTIYRKAYLKLHALVRLSRFMNKGKLRLFMKSFVEFQLSCCRLIWRFHNRQPNNKINRLHERALRLVYNNSTLSFDELLTLDNSYTVHHRNLQKVAIEMYKVKNNLSPSFMKTIYSLSRNNYELRSQTDFKIENIKTVSYGSENISYRGPKIWELIPQDTKNSKNLLEFKRKVKHWIPSGYDGRLCNVYIHQVGFIENIFFFIFSSQVYSNIYYL